jgi:hypothetical protein
MRELDWDHKVNLVGRKVMNQLSIAATSVSSFNVAALLLCAAVCRGFLGEAKTTVGVVSYLRARIGTHWSDSKGHYFCAELLY